MQEGRTKIVLHSTPQVRSGWGTPPNHELNLMNLSLTLRPQPRPNPDPTLTLALALTLTLALTLALALALALTLTVGVRLDLRPRLQESARATKAHRDQAMDPSASCLRGDELRPVRT